MGKQSILVKEILSLYDTILENNELDEVSDVYDNVDFKDRVVGNSTPTKDTINTALLQDIQTAAKSVGLQVDITTAVSGHKNQKSRHMSGNAVDISKINGKPVRPSNRKDADKLVNALVQMGYTKNVENSSNPKSILTFGFKGHDNHIHISNTGGASSITPSKDTTSELSGDEISMSKDPFYSTAPEDELMKDKGLEIGKIFKPMTEQKIFGKNISNRYGRIIIPKETNSRIKSPISGQVYNKKYNSNCLNQVTIKNTDNKPFYLQFCGISSPSVRDGESISPGTTLGSTDTDVEVSKYDSSWNRVSIDNGFISQKPKEIEVDNYRKKDKNSGKTYADPLTAIITSLPGKSLGKVFGDKYDKSGNRIEKRWGGVSDKKQVDPWLLNMIKKPFKKKVTENIEKIKKLL